MALPDRELPCHQGAVKRAMPFRTASLVVGLVAIAFIVLAACSNQGEGERCDVGNGNDDCRTNLVCYAAASLTNSTADRCCPQDRATSTEPVCKTAVNLAGGDAAAPIDSGPAPVTADATVQDTGTAPADAAHD
jgi:hypothetical protein